jgi:arylsulfatase A-like enzyme
MNEGWMNRRYKFECFAATLWVLISLARLAESFASEGPLNIVFMMADDLGWNDVGFHGGQAPTPNLDRLASSSLELTRHYVAPVCSPTRTGLMTGRFWSRFDVTKPVNVRALPWETPTLPRRLKALGYDTALIGKWHLGSRPEEGPGKFGFDHSYGSLAGGVSPWSHRYKAGDVARTWHRNGMLIDEPGHVTDLLTAEAIRWIEDRPNDRPFFLYLPITAVHLPIKEPASWVERVPGSIRGDVARHYAACVMHLDDTVGKILDTLERKQVRDRTIVIFTSDNGGSTAENNDPKYPDDGAPSGRLTGNNAPLRGGKAELYEGGTRVPTIVHWPNKITPGRNDTPVSIVDWMPTLCSLAEGDSSPRSDNASFRWDGVDLSAMLRRGDAIASRPIYAVGVSGKERSLWMGDWKLIVRGEIARPDTIELYQIANDPSESHDLVAQQPHRASELLAAMRRIAAADGESRVRR